MMIGITGPSFTGKTTLAREFAARNPEFHFCETSASYVIKQMGVDISKPMSFEQRMDLQEAILDQMKMDWVCYGSDEKVIADRTPFCMIAYTLDGIDLKAELTNAQRQRLNNYIGRCIGLYATFFDKIVLLSGVIDAPDTEEGKVRANLSEAYSYMNELTLRGLVHKYGVQVCDIEAIDLDVRIAELSKLVS